MLRHFIGIALKNITKHKRFSLINIGGLAVGLAACMLILVFVRSEIGYDNFWADSERIHRIESVMKIPGMAPQITSLATGPLNAALEKDLSSMIDAATRIRFSGGVQIRHGEELFRVPVYMVDPGFIDVFNIQMISGSAAAAFADNRSVLISEAQAIRLFGDENPLDQTLTLDMGLSQNDYRIVGVMADMPTKSHMNPEVITLFDQPMFVEQPWIAELWFSHNLYAYVKLAEGITADEFEAAIPAVLDRNFDPAQALKGTGIDDLMPSDMRDFSLINVPDIHLYSMKRPQLKPIGSIVQINILTTIGIAILLIAMINFTNLANARSLKRLKEIGLRKMYGGRRRQLMTQFLGEAVVMAALAALIAIPMAELAAPIFSEMVGTPITIFDLFEPGSMAVVLPMIVLTGVLGGLYPAMILSSENPAALLGGSRTGPRMRTGVSTFLVTLQFSAAVALVVMTSIVWLQGRFVESRDIGIDQQNKFEVFGLTTAQARPIADTIRDRVLALDGVEDVTAAQRSVPLFGRRNPSASVTHAGGNFSTSLESVYGRANLLEFLGAELIAGRFFGDEFQGDLPQDTADGQQQSLIITRSTARALGYDTADAAIGEVANLDLNDDTPSRLVIVGVVADLSLRSARADDEYLGFFATEAPAGVMYVAMTPDNQAATRQAIEEIWSEMVPGRDMSSMMMDEIFANFYTDDARQVRVYGYSALLAILIAAVGLYGLASFTSEFRTREIGVRKCLGAEVKDIVRLIMWQFSKPVVLANLIGWPVAAYVMQDWLSGFSERIDLPLAPFMLAGLGVLALALITVGLQVIGVARTSPVVALRHE